MQTLRAELRGIVQPLFGGFRTGCSRCLVARESPRTVIHRQTAVDVVEAFNPVQIALVDAVDAQKAGASLADLDGCGTGLVAVGALALITD